MRTLALAGLSLIGWVIWAGSVTARIQGEMYCWGLDSELPVPCDHDDAEEEEVSGVRFQVSGMPASAPRPETRSLKPDT